MFTGFCLTFPALHTFKRCFKCPKTLKIKIQLAQTFFLTVNWGTLGANQAAAYPEDHFFFETYTGLLSIFCPPYPQKNEANKQTTTNQPPSDDKPGCVLPKRPTPSFRALLSGFLLKGRAARSCTRMRRGMRRALPLVLELGRHRSRHCGIRGWKGGEKKRSEKHLCVTLMLWYFEFGPGTSETKWAEFFSPLLWQLQRCQVDKRQGSRGELSTSTPMPVSQQELVLCRQKFVLSSSDRTRDSFFSLPADMHRNAPNDTARVWFWFLVFGVAKLQRSNTPKFNCGLIIT